MNKGVLSGCVLPLARKKPQVSATNRRDELSYKCARQRIEKQIPRSQPHHALLRYRALGMTPKETLRRVQSRAFAVPRQRLGI